MKTIKETRDDFENGFEKEIYNQHIKIKKLEIDLFNARNELEGIFRDYARHMKQEVIENSHKFINKLPY